MAGMTLEQEIKDKARELGFDAVGITDASPLGREHAEHFQQWLAHGCAGRMDYMTRNLDKRLDPAKLRKGAQSMIVVALNYKPQEVGAKSGSQHESSRSEISNLKSNMPVPASGSQSEISNLKSQIGRIAAYAQYEDYHAFIKSLLRELATFLSVRAGRPDRYRICVDSAPLAEKAFATRAGLGFIGRNHLLIHPRLGPQVLLGELVTTLPLHPDEPGAGTCGDCDRCTKACPTGALQADGFLDARRCISYQTQYEPPDACQGDTHGWLFGCDECLLACPHQQSAPPRSNTHFKHHPDRATLNLRDLLTMSAETFATQFADSPLKRPGLAVLQARARESLKVRG